MTTSSEFHQRLAVCSWSMGTDSVGELIQGLRELGLSGVQLALCPVCDAAPGWIDAIARIRDAGLTVVSGMFGTVGEDYSSLDSIRRTGGFVLDATWEANRNIVRRVAALAKSAGLTHVSAHAGFITDEDVPAFTDRLRHVADCFADHGLTLLLETGQETAATLERFLDRLARPNVTVNFDPANMILYAKGDPIEALRRLLPRIEQVHIKDARRTATPGTWGTEVAAGQGQVDWPAFVRTLESGGFRGRYVIEREAGETRLTDIRAAAKLITSLL